MILEIPDLYRTCASVFQNGLHAGFVSSPETLCSIYSGKRYYNFQIVGNCRLLFHNTHNQRGEVGSEVGQTPANNSAAAVVTLPSRS